MTLNDPFGSTAAPLKRRHPKAVAVITLTIISHYHPKRLGDVFYWFGDQLQLSRLGPDFKQPGTARGAPLHDPYISRTPIHMETHGAGGLLLRSNGKTEIAINGEPLEGERVLSRSHIQKGVVLNLADRVVLFLNRSSPYQPAPDLGLVGCADTVCFLRSEITRVADLNTPVLLRGPSGTGKELAAGAIHQLGTQAGKRTGPFVCVNMGAIPPSLASTELFGAVKGAYTGSDRQQSGFFRTAQNGTLFLDEVGETPPEVQVLLLRALETGEVFPVGAQKAVPFSTRFLAATDADLEQKMAENSFKSPLFHRLAGYEIRLPPLSERLEDMGRLFLHFAKQALEEVGDTGPLRPTDPYAEPWIPAQLMIQLLTSSWPGNIRQFRNVVRQLVIGCRGEPVLKLTPNVAEMLNQSPTPKPAAPHPEPPAKKRRKPASIDHEEVAAVMGEQNWDINAAAEVLGISRGALYLLIKKIPGLRTAADLDRETILSVLEQENGDLDATAQTLAVSARALRRRCKDLNIPAS